MRKDVKWERRNSIREVRDHSDAVPGVRSFVGRCISGQGSMKKGRGKVRT